MPPPPIPHFPARWALWQGSSVPCRGVEHQQDSCLAESPLTHPSHHVFPPQLRFQDCISEQDLDEMNIEIIRNTLYKVGRPAPRWWW